MRALRQLLLAIAITTWGVPPAVNAQAPTDEFPPAPESTPQLVRLLEQVDRDALHQDPQWLALVHYEKNRFSSGVYSPAITPDFFLSERGDRDPRAELHATLLSFFDPAPLAQGQEHPLSSLARGEATRWAPFANPRRPPSGSSDCGETSRSHRPIAG